jgi:peptidoglycan/LPS O-acetylase OafA/YrhL
VTVAAAKTDSSTPPGGSSRLRHIDAMRAVAALLVLIHHTFDTAIGAGTASSLSGAISAINGFVDFGRYGVDLFFIISGYVIPFSLLGRPGHAVRAFVVSRACRLYPMYWVTLAAYLLVMLGPTGGTTIALNASLLHKFLGVKELVGQSWTLQVELVFYALSAVLFASGILLRPKRVAVLFFAIVVYLLATAALRLGGGPLLPFGWPTFMALMVGGTLLRFVDRRQLPGGAVVAAAVVVFLAVKLAVAMLVYADPSRSGNYWTQDFNPVFAAVTTFLLMNGRLRLTWRPAAWVGAISYSVYLLHPLVAALVLPAATEFIGRDSPFATFGVLLVAVLTVSSATYLLVERPFVEVGHKIARRMAARAAPQVLVGEITP